MNIKTLTFLGHSGILFTADHNGKTIHGAIDPWMTGNPVYPESMGDPESLDLLILTHGHFDHAGDASRLCKQYGCKLVAIYELCSLLQSEGVPESNCIGMNKGGTVQLFGMQIQLTNAFHSNGYQVSDGSMVYAGEACGVVLKADNVCLYHAGDTCLFSDMALIGDRWKPDVSLLPIGDRFTMGPGDAAKAAKLLGSSRIIPIHYNTFDLLTGTFEAFTEAVQKEVSADLDVIRLNPGDQYTL